jgi:hypothetical protein
MRVITSCLILCAVAISACTLAGSEKPTPTRTPYPIDATAVPVIEASVTDTATPTPSYTPSDTLTPSNTPTPTETGLPSETPLPSPTPVTSRLYDPTGRGVFLRQVPGTAGDIVQIMYEDYPIDFVGRTEDSIWFQVRLESGILGWLPAAYVDTSLTVEDQPVTGTVQNRTEDQPDAMVKEFSDGLRLRVTPGEGNRTLAFLDTFTPLTVVGRTEDNLWLEVDIPDGTGGWVALEHVELYVRLEDVPVTGAAATATPGG